MAYLKIDGQGELARRPSELLDRPPAIWIAIDLDRPPVIWIAIDLDRPGPYGSGPSRFDSI